MANKDTTKQGKQAQKPIEAMHMIEACNDAYGVTRDEYWAIMTHRCLEWFLGRNDLAVPLYDYQTGGCSDGLDAKGPNKNQGAESTISWLLSLVKFHCQSNGQALELIDSISEPVKAGATN